MLGKKVVKEMNRIGMVIDISHVSDKTFFNVLEVTEDPVIASHSGCRSLNPHRRNMSDEDIKKIMGGNFLRVWKTVTQNKNKQ